MAIRAALTAAAEGASPASLLAFKDAVLLACTALGESKCLYRARPACRLCWAHAAVALNSKPCLLTHI